MLLWVGVLAFAGMTEKGFSSRFRGDDRKEFPGFITFSLTIYLLAMRPFQKLSQFISIGFLFLPASLLAQSLSVGTTAFEDYYRSAQLLRKIDSTFSFLARPFYPSETLGIDNIFDPDQSLKKEHWRKWDGAMRFAGKKGFIQLLPVTILTKYSRPIPLSMNDGAMIPAKGFQTVASAGIYAKLGPLSIQLQPEFLYAENKPYSGFIDMNGPNVYDAYYHTYNYIDLPEQFGTVPYKRALWGQSSIRLNFGPVSFGVSNENLWWGPGYRNSLLMTNSAPGFRHLTFNTTKPIRTPIGNFEFQVVAGKLDSSGFTPPLPQSPELIQQYYIPKPHDWRYFNGLVLTYMPKWVPGLFLGASRAFMIYGDALGNKVSSYLPVFLPMTEKNTNMTTENAGADQLASVFIRWLWLKENAELYLEYGREDRSADLRDLFLDLSHSRGYILGIRKFFPLKNKKDQQIEVRLEATQLEALLTRRWKSYTPYVSSWYTHSQIRHGYTQVGQLLGAGIGPGSNLQTFNFNWVHGIKKIGIQFERYQHNNDLLENANQDTRRRWVDFIVSLVGAWDYKNLVFTVQIDGINSINYQFAYTPPGENPDYWTHGKGIFSLQALLGVMYRF